MKFGDWLNGLQDKMHSDQMIELEDARGIMTDLGYIFTTGGRTVEVSMTIQFFTNSDGEIVPQKKPRIEQIKQIEDQSNTVTVEVL